MHLNLPGYTYSACGPFTKNKDRVHKFKEAGDTKYIYRNELHKARFQHHRAYGSFKDVAKRTASHKVLRPIAFNIAKNPKYDGCQRGLVCMVYKFFDKKFVGTGVTTLANKSVFNNEIKQNLQLAEELHKPIIKKFLKKNSLLHLKTISRVLIWLICNQ